MPNQDYTIHTQVKCFEPYIVEKHLLDFNQQVSNLLSSFSLTKNTVQTKVLWCKRDTYLVLVRTNSEDFIPKTLLCCQLFLIGYSQPFGQPGASPSLGRKGLLLPCDDHWTLAGPAHASGCPYAPCGAVSLPTSRKPNWWRRYGKRNTSVSLFPPAGH